MDKPRRHGAPLRVRSFSPRVPHQKRVVPAAIVTFGRIRAVVAIKLFVAKKKNVDIYTAVPRLGSRKSIIHAIDRSIHSLSRVPHLHRSRSPTSGPRPPTRRRLRWTNTFGPAHLQEKHLTPFFCLQRTHKHMSRQFLPEKEQGCLRYSSQSSPPHLTLIPEKRPYGNTHYANETLQKSTYRHCENAKHNGKFF